MRSSYIPSFLSSMNESIMNWEAASLYSSDTKKVSLDIMMLKPKERMPYSWTRSKICSLCFIVSSLSVTDRETSAPSSWHLFILFKTREKTGLPDRSTRIWFSASVNPSTDMPIPTPSALSFSILSSSSNNPLVTMDISRLWIHFSFARSEFNFSAI